jgi:hypothetical protein
MWHVKEPSLLIVISSNRSVNGAQSLVIGIVAGYVKKY